MIVKICGIKTLEAALAAADCGADMLGFNFYPSSLRCISLENCASIVDQLRAHYPSLITVGVFVNQDPQQVLAAIEFCGLDLVQLSGDEPAQDLALMNGRAFKSVRPRTLQEADEALVDFARRQPPALLVDAHVKGAYGGTGKTGNWAVARSLGAQVPLLLAGGLAPDNVAQAISQVSPWGVDVASGVETSPGIKDSAKIAAFIVAAKSIQG